MCAVLPEKRTSLEDKPPPPIKLPDYGLGLPDREKLRVPACIIGPINLPGEDLRIRLPTPLTRVATMNNGFGIPITVEAEPLPTNTMIDGMVIVRAFLPSP